MKRKAYQFAVPATLIIVMVAFLSTIFFVNANLSFAASGKKKSSAVARTSAVDRTEAQIKQLQGVLNITKDQEGLWINLTQVMRGNAKDMDALTKDRMENTKKMNAVEYMKFHNQISEAYLDQQKKFLPPFEALYDSMSDQQKNITDILFQTGKYGKHQKRK